MSAKKVFHVKDKVFAKIRGYPAWPAMVSAVKVDTPSRQRYSVYFYGTGERAECKPDELFPYEENKLKLGKPNKRKYFAEALLEIEHDACEDTLGLTEAQVAITPSNIDQELSKDKSVNSEIEKNSETNKESERQLTNDDTSTPKEKKVSTSKKSLGMPKGTKRKISDGKSDSPSKKSMSNKSRVSESLKSKDTYRHKQFPVIIVEALNESLLQKLSNAHKTNDIANKINTDVKVSESTDKQSETQNESELILESNDDGNDNLLDNNKTPKSISKVKGSPTSGSEISSSNSSIVGHVSRSGRKIKPKKYSDFENNGDVPKRSRPSKENIKNSEKHNTSNVETDNVSEQNKTHKDTSSNSEVKKISKSQASATIPHINDSATNEIMHVNKEINDDNELPAVLKGLMTDAITDIGTGWKKVVPGKTVSVETLNTELTLLDCIFNLRVALRTNHVEYQTAIDMLEQMNQLEISALMLKKHQEVVDTITKVTRYIGDASNWDLNNEEAHNHDIKSSIIRNKANILYNKFISLFAVPDGETFHDVFQNEVDNFFDKTKHLAFDQIYGLTSDKLYK